MSKVNTKIRVEDEEEREEEQQRQQQEEEQHGCSSRILEIRDLSSVKIFKETTV